MKRTTWAPVVAGILLSVFPAAFAQTKPAGEPVPEESAVFESFRTLEKQSAYRVVTSIESSDPRMAQAAAMGMAMEPSEKLVKNGVNQVTMHMKMPSDQRGTVDDFEIKAVVQNGRGAHIIRSPAIDRLLKENEQRLAMEMAMLNQQAAMAMARAAAMGPFGAIQAGVMGAETIAMNAMAARELKKEKEMFEWKCEEHVGSQGGDQKRNQLTDLRILGDDASGGTPATAYEFFVRDGETFHGPARLLVAKSTGLPLRLDMSSPEMKGRVHMVYSYENIGEIEMPGCLAGKK